MKTFLFACGAALTTFCASAQQITDTTKTEKLDEVLVQAIRVTAQSPITHSDLNHDEIQKRNLGQDLPMLLNNLTSVVSTSDAGAGIGYTGFRVRGTGNQGINVTINGIPYNDGESLTTFFVDVADFSSSVENMQLQRGVGTSTNGGAAFGASLNILTDAVNRDAFAEISGSTGSFNTHRANIKFGSGLLNDHFTLGGRFSVIKSDGYIDRAYSDLKSYFLQGAYVNGNTLIKVLGFGGFEETYQAYNGIDRDQLENDRTYNPSGMYTDADGNVRFYDNEVDNYRQDHLQLLWNQRYDSHWSSNFALHYTYGRGYFEQYKEDRDFADYGLELIIIATDTINTTDLIQRRWLSNNFWGTTASVNYKNKTVDFTTGGAWNIYAGDHYGEILWARNASNSEKRDRYYTGLGDKTDFNAFAKATVNLTSNLSVYGDLQIRGINYSASGAEVPEPVDKDYFFFNPKAGLSLNLTAANNLYLSYGRANREPNRTDFENGSPEAERLNDFELGYRFKKDRSFFNANAYYMDYRNQLVLTGAIDDVGAPIRTNSGSSYRLGLELEAGVRFFKWLATSPNLALSTNKNRNFFFERDGVLQDLGDTDISFSPEIVAGNKLDFYPVKDFRISLLSKYVGDQYLSNIDATKSKLDSYFVNDVNVQYELKNIGFTKSIVLTALINNIFNVEYVNNGYFFTYDDDSSGSPVTVEGAGYFPQATLNFLVGATVRF